jgi:hypothetical protein
MSTAGGNRPGAGRPKGAKNKRTQEIQDRLEELDCDPIEGMAMISADPTTSPELKFQCYKELAQYVAPKRKAVDMTSTIDGNYNIQVLRFSEDAIDVDD